MDPTPLDAIADLRALVMWVGGVLVAVVGYLWRRAEKDRDRLLASKDSEILAARSCADGAMRAACSALGQLSVPTLTYDNSDDASIGSWLRETGTQ